MTPKPIAGKYRFNKAVSITVPLQVSNMGITLTSQTYHFNIGNVIDAQNFFYNDKSGEWGAQVSVITAQNRSVPVSALTKVPDHIPVTTNIKTDSSKTVGSPAYKTNPSINPLHDPRSPEYQAKARTKRILMIGGLILLFIGLGLMIKKYPKATIGTIAVLFIYIYFFVGIFGPSRYEQWKSRGQQPKTPVTIA